MTRKETEWVRVSKSEPCAICEKPDHCTRTADGALARCTRIESDRASIGRDGVPAWLHKLSDTPSPRRPRKAELPRRSTDEELHHQWTPLLRKMWCPKLLPGIARVLGVSVASLRALYVSLDGNWVFPERNHAGLFTGLKRRLPGGGQMYFVGSRPGLYYANDWYAQPGPVFIVEGGSDTAAGITLGLSVVGRPSNTGGAKVLAKLLWPHKHKTVVVLGERDRKPHDTLSDAVRARHKPDCSGCQACWPGLHGARATVAVLKEKLPGRHIGWRLPPDGAKDLREWLNRQGVDVEDVAAMARLGRELWTLK